MSSLSTKYVSEVGSRFEFLKIQFVPPGVPPIICCVPGRTRRVLSIRICSFSTNIIINPAVIKKSFSSMGTKSQKLYFPKIFDLLLQNLKTIIYFDASRLPLSIGMLICMIYIIVLMESPIKRWKSTIRHVFHVLIRSTTCAVHKTDSIRFRMKNSIEWCTIQYR